MSMATYSLGPVENKIVLGVCGLVGLALVVVVGVVFTSRDDVNTLKAESRAQTAILFDIRNELRTAVSLLNDHEARLRIIEDRARRNP